MEKFNYTWDSENEVVTKESDRNFLKSFKDVERLATKQKPIAEIEAVLKEALWAENEQPIILTEHDWFKVQQKIEQSEGDPHQSFLDQRDTLETSYPHLKDYRGITTASRPTTEPVQQDIDDWKLAEWECLRRGAYGTWQTQFNNQYDDATAEAARIAQVKTDFPKP